jgi:hypothetical protein
MEQPIDARDLFAVACRIERGDVGKAQGHIASAQACTQGSADFPAAPATRMRLISTPA